MYLLLSQFDAIRGYEEGTGLLMLCDGAGTPIALADLGERVVAERDQRARRSASLPARPRSR